MTMDMRCIDIFSRLNNEFQDIIIVKTIASINLLEKKNNTLNLVIIVSFVEHEQLCGYIICLSLSGILSDKTMVDRFTPLPH